jgi:hypothetical protein
MLNLLNSVADLLLVFFYPLVGGNGQAGFLGQGEITWEDEFRLHA